MEILNSYRLYRGLYYIVLFDNDIHLADFKENTVPVIKEGDLNPLEIQRFELEVDCKTMFEGGDHGFVKRSIRLTDIYTIFPQDRLVSRIRKM